MLIPPEELWGDPTITDHCDVCTRPIHRYHGTSWLHDTQPDQHVIDDHLARPHTTHDPHDPDDQQEAP